MTDIKQDQRIFKVAGAICVLPTSYIEKLKEEAKTDFAKEFLETLLKCEIKKLKSREE